jgi:hypothetical protein
MKTVKDLIFFAVFTMTATGMFAGQTILQQNFNLMTYGGDAIGGAKGKIVDVAKTPWDITTDPGKVSLPDPAESIECAYTMLATQFFGAGTATTAGGGAISDTYKALRGILGWTGSYVFEQPGYVTLGHSSSTDNWLSTPPLSNIVGTKDLRVSFKIARRANVSANTRMTVSVTGGGTITANVGGGAPTSLATAPGGIDFPIAEGGVWLEKGITVTGATSETKIRFETTVYETGVRNFSLDDIFVTTTQTYYVSNNGSDDNPGSRHLPLKTISKAAEVAQPGDTVFVLEGIYRERVAPARGGTATQPIVYMGEPGKQVFIRGSDIYDKTWNAHSGNVYAADLNEMQFTDDAYWDDANPFKVISAGNPYGTSGKLTLGQVFVEGEPYTQKESPDDVAQQPGSWRYDNPTNRVYVNFKPNHSISSLVEITTRRRIFAPHKRGLGYIHVTGFIMEHCGNQFPTEFYSNKLNAQAGALGLRRGHHWLVKNNIIRHATSIGLDCGTETDSEDIERFDQPAVPAPVSNIIEYNYLINNGSCGIAGKGTTGMIVRGNVVMYNNTLSHDAYEESGMKFHNCTEGLITANYVAGNHTYGIWLDNRYFHTRVTGNLVVHNKKGIKVEMGDYDFGAVLIDHNILIGNVENQYYSHDASGVLVVNNLIAGTKNDDFGQGVYVRQVTERTHSKNNAFYNNIICNNDYQYDILYPIGKGGEQRFLGNLYDKNESFRGMCINNMTNKPNPDYTASQFKKQIILKAMSFSFQNSNNTNLIRATLNRSEWLRFWSNFTDSHNDNDAEMMTGLSASYNAQTLTVSLNLPAATGKRLNSRWDGDYKDIYNLTEESSCPGPFDNIQAGLNEYVYRGLPPVEPDELPSFPTDPGVGTPIHKIEAAETGNITVYPNPAADFLHFYSRETVRAIDIFNLQGVVVRSITPPSDSRISLNDLPAGMYLLQFTTAGNRRISVKISKI